ncbi:MAG TPA: hypothetical protein VGB89_11410 [Bacteroidota bacterium]
MKWSFIIFITGFALASCGSEKELVASYSLVENTVRTPTDGPLDVYSVFDTSKIPYKYETIAYITLEDDEEEFADSTKTRAILDITRIVGADAVIMEGKVERVFADRHLRVFTRHLTSATAIVYVRNN